MTIKQMTNIITHKISSDHIEIPMAEPVEMGWKDVRLAAYDRNGNQLMAGGTTTVPSERKLIFTFLGRVGNVGSVELQERDYRWTEIRHIPVRPIDDLPHR